MQYVLDHIIVFDYYLLFINFNYIFIIIIRFAQTEFFNERGYRIKSRSCRLSVIPGLAFNIPKYTLHKRTPRHDSDKYFYIKMK